MSNRGVEGIQDRAQAAAMSRRESRDAPSKRLLSSRPDRSPSPKKSRRDGKPATERTHNSSHDVGSGSATEREQKQRRRLQDALPLEDPQATGTKVEPDSINKELEKNVDELPDGTKDTSAAIEVPRSRSYFQHDNRGSAGYGGRSFSRREHRRWSDPKEQPNDRARDQVENKDERTQSRSKVKDTWRHDKFHELEDEAPPARKRPAFREKKMQTEPESVPAPTASEAVRSHHDRSISGSARREDRGHYSRGLDKPERQYTRAEERNTKRGDEHFNVGDTRRNSYQARDRYGRWGMGGRDRYNGRYGENNTHRHGGSPVEKWAHDLFDEANKSPTQKNEEEQIAKVEALLAL